MRKVVIIIMLGIIAISVMLFRNDGGSGQVADQMNLETIRGDIVELQGKGMYYKNKYGMYPAHNDDVYSMEDGVVVASLSSLEKYFDKVYIENNIKLVNDKELKSKGITYELANRNTRYFYDITTGAVISPDLMDRDEKYRDEVREGTGEYKVLETIDIVDSDDPEDLTMTQVNGSFKSGSSVYFYGSGTMQLARRDEMTKIIKRVDPGIALSNLDEILYIQPDSSKAVILKGGNLEIVTLKFK